ncbi:hypothetical protein HDZ31DRAFT_18143, partial [Schizophyllum fasciatum]
KRVILVGDLNMRMGNLQAGDDSLPRDSSDHTVDSRGRAFIHICAQMGLKVLNGTSLEIVHPGACTSFQSDRSSTVIDYLIVS